VGETAAFFTPQIVEAVAKLLKEAGDDFAVLKDEPQSGAELGDLIGYVEETVDCGRELADRIAKSDAKTVVVLDPNCAKVIKQEYPQWGCEVKAQVVTATSYLAQLVAGGKLKPSKLDLTGVTYHDSDRLARDLDETEPARTLFSAMGISVKEMFLNKQTTRSCGDAALKVHSPKIAALTAEGRWEDVERCGAKILVTACPACYTILGENVPKGYQLKDLFVLLAESCGL